jgi:hypothetical protein
VYKILFWNSIIVSWTISTCKNILMVLLFLFG